MRSSRRASCPSVLLVRHPLDLVNVLLRLCLGGRKQALQTVQRREVAAVVVEACDDVHAGRGQGGEEPAQGSEQSGGNGARYAMPPDGAAVGLGLVAAEQWRGVVVRIAVRRPFCSFS